MSSSSPPLPDPAPPAGDVVTLHWDFFGPRARGTAVHFEVHVKEFLDREKLAEGATTGLAATGPFHAECWCKAPKERAELIATALKPRRRS